jgi:hypothetical protein
MEDVSNFEIYDKENTKLVSEDKVTHYENCSLMSRSKAVPKKESCLRGIRKFCKYCYERWLKIKVVENEKKLK